MPKMPFFSMKSMILSALVIALSIVVVGCHGDDSAPTNTKNSTYIDSGQSAADKIGQDRENAHRARLPGKGVGGGN